MSIGPLDLSNADLTGFDAVEPNRYNAEVFEMKMDAVKNTSGEGKMPAGTPMVKVQFKLTDPAVENRRVFVSYVIPPDDYDPSKAQKMRGMLARFFMALGEPEEKVLGKNFDPEFDDYIGRPCVVVVGKEPKKNRDGSVIEGEFNNPVRGVKPAGSAAGGSTNSGLL